MIVPRSIALEGIGYGPLATASLGFLSIEVEVVTLPSHGGFFPEYEEPRERFVRIMVRVQYKGVMTEKRFALYFSIVGRVAAKLLKHKRQARRTVVMAEVL